MTVLKHTDPVKQRLNHLQNIAADGFKFITMIFNWIISLGFGKIKLLHFRILGNLMDLKNTKYLELQVECGKVRNSILRMNLALLSTPGTKL